MTGRAAGYGCLTLVVGGVGLAFVMLLFVSGVGGVLTQQMTAGPGFGCGPGITGNVDDDMLTAQQRRNVKVIASVGHAMGIPPEGWVVAIATAYQESRLRNVTYGDRDSLGLFQQRPSMGWGAPEQVTDPRYAARQFYAHLREVDGWRDLPVTVAAQAVQRSAFPDAYQEHVPMARKLVTQLTSGDVVQAGGSPGNGGVTGAGALTTADFSCPGTNVAAAGRSTEGDWLPEQMGSEGLTPRTRHVLELVERRFDEHNIGGYCPGGCTSGHVPGSDHYDGHAIDIMITPYTDPARVAKGLRMARWIVANHRRLAIDYIIYRKRILDFDEAAQGWQPYTHPSGSSDPTLAHMDHIHVSVY